MGSASAPLFDSVKEKIILIFVKTVKKILFRTIAISVKTVGIGERDWAQHQVL